MSTRHLTRKALRDATRERLQEMSQNEVHGDAARAALEGRYADRSAKDLALAWSTQREVLSRALAESPDRRPDGRQANNDRTNDQDVIDDADAPVVASAKDAMTRIARHVMDMKADLLYPAAAFERMERVARNNSRWWRRGTPEQIDGLKGDLEALVESTLTDSYRRQLEAQLSSSAERFAELLETYRTGEGDRFRAWWGEERDRRLEEAAEGTRANISKIIEAVGTMDAGSHSQWRSLADAIVGQEQRWVTRPLEHPLEDFPGGLMLRVQSLARLKGIAETARVRELVLSEQAQPCMEDLFDIERQVSGNIIRSPSVDDLDLGVKVDDVVDGLARLRRFERVLKYRERFWPVGMEGEQGRDLDVAAQHLPADELVQTPEGRRLLGKALRSTEGHDFEAYAFGLPADELVKTPEGCHVLSKVLGLTPIGVERLFGDPSIGRSAADVGR